MANHGQPLNVPPSKINSPTERAFMWRATRDARFLALADRRPIGAARLHLQRHRLPGAPHRIQRPLEADGSRREHSVVPYPQRKAPVALGRPGRGTITVHASVCSPGAAKPELRGDQTRTPSNSQLQAGSFVPVLQSIVVFESARCRGGAVPYPDTFDVRAFDLCRWPFYQAAGSLCVCYCTLNVE